MYFICRLFPWGNKEMPHNEYRMNVWQGDNFPMENLGEDGYVKTCPVRNIFTALLNPVALGYDVLIDFARMFIM
jgi:hypothetical protein